MVRHHQRNAAIRMHSTAKVRKGATHLQQRFGRGRAERHDHLGPNQLDLALEVGHARNNLVGERLPVSRRAAFDRVRYEHLLPGEPYRLDDLIEQLTGPPDERPSGLVLHLSRSLSDEEKAGVRGTFTRNRVGSAIAEETFAASRDNRGDFIQIIPIRRDF